MKSHRFRGRKYKVIIDTLDGYAEVPGREPPAIYLRSDQTALQFLETSLHEGMHAEDPEIPERVVDRRAKALSRWLWRLGYRRVTEHD